MSTFSEEVEQGLLAQLLTGAAYADLTPMKVSLHDDDPGNTGAHEIAGGSYARQAVAVDKWTAPTNIGSGSASYNVEPVVFADMPDATVRHIGLWSNDGSVFVMSGPVDSGGTHVAAAASFTVAAGRLRVKLN